MSQKDSMDIKIVKELTIEQDIVRMFAEAGRYKEVIELIVKFSPKRIEMKEK